MFARSALRLSQRAARPTSFAPLTARATFKSSSRTNDPEVPVVSYRSGERSEEQLRFDAAKNSGPVSPPGADIEKHAVPLRPEIHSKLTPTLQKFTLPGKVAVVTGYVLVLN